MAENETASIASSSDEKFDEIPLEENEFYQVLTTVCDETFKDNQGNNIAQLLAGLVKIMAEQNNLHSQLINRVDNLTEAVQRIANKLN